MNNDYSYLGVKDWIGIGILVLLVMLLLILAVSFDKNPPPCCTDCKPATYNAQTCPSISSNPFPTSDNSLENYMNPANPLSPIGPWKFGWKR